MRLKTANGKSSIILTKADWEAIGHSQGWLKSAGSWPELERRQRELEMKRWINDLMVGDESLHEILARIPPARHQEFLERSKRAQESEDAMMEPARDENDQSFGL